MRPSSGLSLYTSFHHPPPDCPLSATTPTSPTSSAASPSSPFRRLYRSSGTSSRSQSPTSNSSPSPSASPFRLSDVFRRPSLVLLRRRPSKVDVALSEERSRCDGDAIERQGLDLMEPRPVDPIGGSIESVFSSMVGDRASTQSHQSNASRLSQPRFVMGGIFEVMEGRA